jgi:hypothetical protein
LIGRLQIEWQDKDEENTAKKSPQACGNHLFRISGLHPSSISRNAPRLFSRTSRDNSGTYSYRRQRRYDDNSLFKKITIAEKLGSRALQAEAKETLVCDLQNLTVLIGLGANFLFGWWWADPVAVLGLVPS